MSAIVTASEMRAAEAAAVAGGSSESELMRRAGEQIATWIDDRIVRTGQRRVVALVGPGNNGGDALVALSLLHTRGWHCSAVLLGRSGTGELPADPDHLAAIATVDADAITQADIVLDGVFGIGGRADVPNAIADAFQVAWRSRITHRTPMIAIDIPSGTDASSGEASEHAFRADATLCLGLVKRGLTLEPAASFAGELVILPIGIDVPPSGLRGQMITQAHVQEIIPRRNAFAHKSDAGTVLVISGAREYYGAPRLATEAAMRAGAGLVALATPNKIVPVVAGQVPEAVFIGLADDDGQAIEAINAFIRDRRSTLRSIVIGPGIGRGNHANALMRFFFDMASTSSIWDYEHGPRFVIDADALNWLSDQEDWPDLIRPAAAILTPHGGEMARLSGVSRREITADPVRFARDAAMTWHQHVVLKVGFTVAAEPSGGVWVAPRATPELATAGTGDVLAGMLGGLLAQGLSLTDAAICGIWIGAEAGRLTSMNRAATSVIARDIIDNLGRVTHRLQSPDWQTW